MERWTEIDTSNPRNAPTGLSELLRAGVRRIDSRMQPLTTL